MKPADSYCAVHRRWLSYPEQRDGWCSWCERGLWLPPLLTVGEPAGTTSDTWPLLLCLACDVPLDDGRQYWCIRCGPRCAVGSA